MENGELAGQLLFILAVASSLTWCAIIFGRIRRRPLLAYEPRRQVPWTGFDVAVVVALAVLSAVLVPAVVFLQFGVDPRNERTPQYVDALLTAVLLSEIITLLSSAGYLLARGFDHKSLGFDTRRLGYDVTVGVVAVLALDFPLLMIQGILTRLWESHHPLIDVIRRNPSPETLSALAVVAVLLAPLLEEFVFRVVIQGWLEKRLRSWRRRVPQLRALPAGMLPITISAALFASLHANGPDPVPIFLLGLALGYLYHQTHRIFPGLVLHMCFNGITMVLLAASLGAPA